MPGSEFRVLPRLPMEFKTYKLVSPNAIGRAMTKGWSPVASVNFQEIVEGVAQLSTKFLIGKGPRTSVQARSSGPMPIMMFPQPDTEQAAAESSPDHVKQVLDNIANMTQEQILELHAELQASKKPSKAESAASEDDQEVDAVREAMDELLDDDADDDDDE